MKAANVSQMAFIDTSANVETCESSAPDVAPHDIAVKSAEHPLPAQYSYDNFYQVLEWIEHFSKVLGHHTAYIFDGHLKLRDYYLSEGDAGGVKSVENLVKNHVGICRFEEETGNFRQKFAGKSARFCEGKFIGWEGEVPYVSSLKGIMVYEI